MRTVGIEQDNIHEEERELFGKFLGVLPHLRTFEFQVAEDAAIISGKVGPDIDDAASINRALERPLSVRVKARRAGTGRPKYTLLGYSQPEETDS